MHLFFADYLERFEWLYSEYSKAIAGLEPEALDWVPGADTNSLCVLVVHICGATRYWLGDVCLGEDSNRNRDSEFAAKGHTEAELQAMLDESLNYVRHVMESLTLDDLPTIRQAPGRTQEFSVSWSLMHSIEHAGVHVGHANITRQLWDQRNTAS